MSDINAGNIWAYLGIDISEYEEGLKTAEEIGMNFADKMQKRGREVAAFGRRLAVSVTAPIAALGALGIRDYAQFNKAITESIAIMGDVSAETQREMENLALTISTQSVHSAKSLAEAYFFLASAGFDVRESMAALPVVAKFAQAGVFDLRRATELLADSVKVLGMEGDSAADSMMAMERVGDVLVRANTLANASVNQFANSLTNKAGAALRVVNKELEEGVAILAAYANVGVKGEEAGTQLAMALRDVQRGAVVAEEVWEKYNIQVFDGTGKMRRFADIVSDMEAALTSLSDKQRRAALMELKLRDRSIQSILAILDQSDAMREFERELQNAAGTMDDVAEKQMQAFANRMKAIWSQVKQATIVLGEGLVPTLEKLAQMGADAAQAWSEWPEWLRQVSIGLAAVAAAAGPAIVVLGNLMIILGGVAKAFIFLGGLGAFAKISAMWNLIGGGAVLGALATTAGLVAATAVAFFKLGEAIGMMGAHVDTATKTMFDMYDAATLNNAAWRDAANIYRKAGSEIEALRKEMQGLEDDSTKSWEMEQKVTQKRIEQSEARIRMLIREREALKEIGRFQEAEAKQRQKQDLMKELRVLNRLLDDQSKVTEALSLMDKQRAEYRAAELALTQAQAALEDKLQKAEDRRLSQDDPFTGRIIKARREMEKAIKEIEEDFMEAGGDPAQLSAITNRLREEFDLFRSNEERKRSLAIQMATATEADKRRLQLEAERQELLARARTEDQKLMVSLWYAEQLMNMRQDFFNSLASDEEKRLMNLAKQAESLMQQATAEADRQRINEWYDRERNKLLKNILDKEAQRLRPQFALQRLTGLEKGTVEGFRAERDIDDESLQYQQDTAANTEAIARIANRLNNQGVTIRDLQQASLSR